jgi:hydrogenase maturation protease
VNGRAGWRRKKTLVLGLGNEILGDDAVGLEVARALRPMIAAADGIEVRGSGETGLALLEEIAGFERLILVDAIHTGRVETGFLHEMDGAGLPALPSLAPHFFGIGEVLSLGRTLGLPVPARVKLFGIEIGDEPTIGFGIAPALQEAIPAIAKRVLATARS